MRLLKYIICVFATVMPAFTSVCARETEDEALDVPGIIFSHVQDSYEWHIVTVGEKHISVFLPVILYDGGWHVFSSKHLAHGEYEGFHIARQGEEYEGKIVNVSGERPFDISITKNVLSLMMSSILLLVIVLLTAKSYRRQGSEMEAPKGLAAFVEPLIMIVHNIAKENIGEKDYRRFSPYLCTAFLFILLNNFLGIVPFFPGGANLTGNIAVTLVLALFTFFTVNIFGTKEYYKEIFNSDVPVFLKPIIPVIEVFSALMKPVSLTIRLFANMLAGHILILCLVCLIFILAKYNAVLFGSITVVSVLMGVFADALECLVAFVQAYVFTVLSSIYIGMAHPEEEK